MYLKGGKGWPLKTGHIDNLQKHSPGKPGEIDYKR